jgi:hypothetical protein
MTTKLERLKEHARITQAVYDDYWRFVMNSGDPINWDVMESMAARANAAANDVTDIEGWGPLTMDDMERWRECTCQPQDALLCPSCLRYTKEKYGDNIPVPGSGIDYGSDTYFLLKEMHENTDTEGSE